MELLMALLHFMKFTHHFRRLQAHGCNHWRWSAGICNWSSTHPTPSQVVNDKTAFLPPLYLNDAVIALVGQKSPCDTWLPNSVAAAQLDSPVTAHQCSYILVMPLVQSRPCPNFYFGSFCEYIKMDLSPVTIFLYRFDHAGTNFSVSYFCPC